MYTACFTGHRRLNGHYRGDAWKKISGHMDEKIIPMLVKKYKITNYISGMALGVDMLAAERILYHKNRYFTPLYLEAAIPYKNQYTIWPEDEQKRYHSILKRADKVKILYGTAYANWKLNKRNKWMVDESRYVIAIWDGTRHGGTFNCYSYAKKMKSVDCLLCLHPPMQRWFSIHRIRLESPKEVGASQRW